MALALFGLGLAAWQAQADPAPPVANQLSLSASASTEVTNDILVITFSTQREGADPAAVQAHLTQAVNAALAEARKAAQPGLVDISTGSFSVQPRYAPKGEPMNGRIQTLSVASVGYRLSHEARDKVRGQPRPAPAWPTGRWGDAAAWPRPTGRAAAAGGSRAWSPAACTA
jgi:uncharacterized protein YggE